MNSRGPNTGSAAARPGGPPRAALLFSPCRSQGGFRQFRKVVNSQRANLSLPGPAQMSPLPGRLHSSPEFVRCTPSSGEAPPPPRLWTVLGATLPQPNHAPVWGTVPFTTRINPRIHTAPGSEGAGPWEPLMTSGRTSQHL